MAPEEPDAVVEPNETPAEPSVDPKDAVIGGMRRELRETKQELSAKVNQLAEDNAYLRGQLEANTTPQLSPLEQAAEAQGVSVDEVQVDGALLRAEQKHQHEQAQAARSKEQEQQRVKDQQAGSVEVMQELTPEKAGEGLDYSTVIQTGQQYMTEADRRDIGQMGRGAARELYDRALLRIRQSGTPEEQALFEQRLTKQLLAKNEQKKPDGEAEKPAEPTPDADEQERIYDPHVERLAEIL